MTLKPSLGPLELETWWLNELTRIHGAGPMDKKLKRMEADVSRLIDLFTTERAGDFGNYMDDPALLLAYGLFFFPQNYARMQFVVREALARSPLPKDRPLRILDVGAGTGAAGFSALHRLSSSGYGPVDFQALDKSGASLPILGKIFHDLKPACWPRATLSTHCADLLQSTALPGPWDLVLVSYALNEVFMNRSEEEVRNWIRAMVANLADDGLFLICEPVVKASSERLEKIRDWLAAEGLARILAPCRHSKPCPMLREERNWCHDVRSWRPPGSLAFLNRKLYHEIEVLKFSFLALARPSAIVENGEPAGARLVAPVMERKGLFEMKACAADGEIYVYEVLTRHLSREEKTRLRHTDRGEVIGFGEIQPVKNGNFRSAKLVWEVE